MYINLHSELNDYLIFWWIKIYKRETFILLSVLINIWFEIFTLLVSIKGHHDDIRLVGNLLWFFLISCYIFIFILNDRLLSIYLIFDLKSCSQRYNDQKNKGNRANHLESFLNLFLVLEPLNLQILIGPHDLSEFLDIIGSIAIMFL